MKEDCPRPEAYLEVEAGSLAPEERRKLEEHAGRCPFCAVERDLARLFDAGPEEAGALREDVGFIVSRLEAAASRAPGRNPAAPRVVLFPQQRPRRLAGFVRLAAAAVLALAVGLAFRAVPGPAPSLPALPQGGAVRAAALEALAPVGEIAAIPGELRWAPVPGGVSYRVRLTAVDGTLLWEGTVAAPPARLPAEAGSRFHRAVVYVWSVEALDVNGARLAESEPVRFLARP